MFKQEAKGACAMRYSTDIFEKFPKLIYITPPYLGMRKWVLVVTFLILLMGFFEHKFGHMKK